jgi:CubicO group peptidase (beta-lactamase class C family)
MSAVEMVERAFVPVQEHIAAGKIPGAVLGVVTKDGDRAVMVDGAAEVVPNQRPMMRETIFDLASLTKVIFTTTRILALAREGVIDLDASLTTIIPDFRQYDVNCWERQVTFRQCLGHLTLFPGVEPIYTYGSHPDTLRAFVLQREWRKLETPVYSDINFILLGIALERIAGHGIRDFALPAGFSWTPDPAITAATERCAWRGRVMVGEVHDENCWAMQGTGHAGLFGTIDAVLDYAKTLIDGTNLDVPVMKRFLSGTRAHGWEKHYRGWSGGDGGSTNVLGHTGFTGTGLWVEFRTGYAWSLLTNRVHPSRHADSGIFALRRLVGDLIKGD